MVRPVGPAEWGGGAPTAIPASGAILSLAPKDWQYHNNDQRALVVRVAGVRLDISNCGYEREWVWIEGHEVEWADREPPGHRMQALIRVAAIPDAARDSAYREQA